MRNWLIPLAVLAWLSGCNDGPVEPDAQNAIYGTVFVGNINNGIADAEVRITHTEGQTYTQKDTTDATGYYAVENVPFGNNLRMRVVAVGYDTISAVINHDPDRDNGLTMRNFEMTVDTTVKSLSADLQTGIQ